MRHITGICIVLALSGGGMAVHAARPATAAITSDPPRDAAHPATMYQLEIPDHGATVFGTFYRAAGVAPHGTVVLLHGLPGYEQNGDLAHTLRRAGWNVLIFHYRGAWGSGGTFSFAHCVEDVQTVLDYLRDPANASKLGVDPRRLVLVGHSLGGFLAGIGAAHDPAVLGAALISPFNPGALAPPVPKPAEQAALAEFRGDTGPLAGATAEGLLGEAQTNAAAWDLRGIGPNLKGRPVLVIHSDDFLHAADAAIAASLRQGGTVRLTEAHLPTDHSYSDHRIALQRILLGWLRQFG